MLPSPPDDPRTDLLLVAAINRGDDEAFDVLYFRYRDWVVRLAERFTGSADDALDVLQETFTYVFRKFPGFSLSARMTTFLYPVVKNLSIAARKRRRREEALEGDFPHPVAPADGVASYAARQELRAVLSRLPEGQREVLLMRFVDGMSLSEIAGALGVPEGTVKSRLHNSIAALKSDEKVRSYFFD